MGFRNRQEKLEKINDEPEFKLSIYYIIVDTYIFANTYLDVLNHQVKLAVLEILIIHRCHQKSGSNDPSIWCKRKLVQLELVCHYLV